MSERARSRLCVACLGLAFGLFHAATAFGQSTGKVAGRVTDETGTPLPGVQVVVEGTSPLRGGVSDMDGYYAIISVDPGTFALVFKFVGFADYRVEGVVVTVNKTTTIDASMREMVLEGEEVVVTADRPIVQMDRTTTTSVMDEKQLQAMPVSSLGEAINLQAGVVDGHFRGGRSGEVNYLINGVPITNVYSNSAAFEVQENVVSNLEVISGVFNAEYGNAMSGIVNVVTKGIPQRWTGSLQVDFGTFASGRKTEYVERTAPGGERFYTVDDFRSVMVPYYEAAGIPNWENYEFNVGGPLLSQKLGFRLTGRYRHSESQSIARDLFSPADSSMGLNTADPPESWIIESTGSGDFVPGYSNTLFLNPNIVYQLSPTVKVEYNGFFTRSEGRGVDHFFKYVPYGQNKNHGLSQNHVLNVRLMLGENAFANLSYSYLHDKSDNYLYDLPDDFEFGSDEPLDPRYVSPQHSSLTGTGSFAVGGNDLSTWDGLTTTHYIGGNYTNQVTRVHQLKAGAALRLHHIKNHSYGIEVSSRTLWQPMVSPSRYNDDRWDMSPMDFAVFVQDKMEFQNLIVNAGLRYDYFDADYQVPIDWSQAGLERIPDLSTDVVGDSTSNRRDTSIRYQFSPRLGIAFPISSVGVIRFSAGLFFQMPELSRLYTNPEYEVDPEGSSNFYGNPDIKPERTLQFEIGLQQGLTQSIGLEATVFSKDVRNLLGVEIVDDVKFRTPAVHYINVDYGTVRGFTLSLYQRPGGRIFWNIDYTLQFAAGSASDPDQAFGRQSSGLPPIRKLQRLNWDRRHVLNNTVTYQPNDRFSFSVINRLQSGVPYTSTRDFVRSYVENNADNPTRFFTDLRVYVAPPFLPQSFQLFLEINNLFDTDAPGSVNSDTGDPVETYSKILFERSGTRVGGLNSIDEYYYYQGRFATPRHVKLGLRVRY